MNGKNGKSIQKKIKGGLVGIILDARCRPLYFSKNPEDHRKAVKSWVKTLDLYPANDNDKQNIASEEKTESSKTAHAYTPGLEVSEHKKHQVQRILPIKGEVLVNEGDEVTAQKIVAETFMPGDIFPINLANKLSMPPSDIPDHVLIKKGDKVEKGSIIAETKGFFGMFKNVCKSPYSGTVETISDITGQIILRGKDHPVNVSAFMPGKVIDVKQNQGIAIEREVTFIQGIFGIGGESFGKIVLATNTPEEILTSDLINEEMKNSIIVGGSRMTSDAIDKAIEVKASGIISGGIDDQDLKEILGYDLGVAITGSEKIGITLIITEGFGDISMAQNTFNLLKSREGKGTSINGTTQIRAGVMRPLIIIPAEKDSGVPSKTVDKEFGLLKLGSTVRIIRDPYFGKIGRVHRLPHNPQSLESGTKTRVLEVVIENDNILTVPRANIELIEG